MLLNNRRIVYRTNLIPGTENRKPIMFDAKAWDIILLVSKERP